jgi:hypothetical protein
MLSKPLELLAEITLPPITQVTLRKRGKNYLLVTYRGELISIRELGVNLREALDVWNQTAEAEEESWRKSQ